jgi:hypothetical protein
MAITPSIEAQNMNTQLLMSILDERPAKYKVIFDLTLGIKYICPNDLQAFNTVMIDGHYYKIKDYR